jgi:hypothetical protein
VGFLQKPPRPRPNLLPFMTAIVTFNHENAAI